MNLELAENSGNVSEKTPQENIVQVMEKRRTVTKDTVHREEYFKFGAGVPIAFGEFQMTVPSDYTVSELLCPNRYIVGKTEVIRQNQQDCLITSPLVVEVSRSRHKLCDSFYEFFSSNINYCNQHNIKYRQSTVNGFPCVFRHKNGEDNYTVLIYNTAGHYITDICFQFNVRCANKDSVVSRILSGIKIRR